MNVLPIISQMLALYEAQPVKFPSLVIQKLKEVSNTYDLLMHIKKFSELYMHLTDIIDRDTLAEFPKELLEETNICVSGVSNILLQVPNIDVLVVGGMLEVEVLSSIGQIKVYGEGIVNFNVLGSSAVKVNCYHKSTAEINVCDKSVLLLSTFDKSDVLIDLQKDGHVICDHRGNGVIKTKKPVQHFKNIGPCKVIN